MDHQRTVAALGRPFKLGMLYDCRSDQLISGLTLWDNADLQKNIGITPKPYTQFDIVASESIEEKTNSLNVEASLKASFMGGLINLEGSAKYLTDSKTSQNQARVTMNYKTTTESRTLSMEHLAHVDYQDVFDKDQATHVVTGILYGAQAFFVFDREVSAEEDRQEIEGSMKVVIKKFPSIAISGKGSVKLDDKGKKDVDKFSCKFIGDFQLKKNPVTFEDAIETYKDLPELLGPNGENAIPMTVWLMPLKVLDSKAGQLVRELSIRLVDDAQSVLEDFSELELRYNDALKSTVAQQFPQISKKLNTFKKRCKQYKLGFQKALADTLPSIRGGGEEESVLADILKRRLSSPFNNNDLNEWMEGKEREINVIKSITDRMEHTKVVTNKNKLEKIILSPTTKQAVCFAFTSLKEKDQYLIALDQDRLLDPQDVEGEPWYSSTNLKSIREKAKLFKECSEANKDNKNMQFLITATANDKRKGASVYLYKDDELKNDNFQLPSKPETPEAIDITHNSVTLKMVPPRSEAEDISHHSIEYCVTGQKEPKWQNTVNKDDEVTVSNLNVNQEYRFRYRAVYPDCNSPFSDVFEIKTLPTNPPEFIGEEFFIAWEQPTVVGNGVTVKYIVEYAKMWNLKPGTYPNDKEYNWDIKPKQLKWNSQMGGDHPPRGPLEISDLEPNAMYAVRIVCDCGADGRSKPSLERLHWTYPPGHPTRDGGWHWMHGDPASNVF